MFHGEQIKYTPRVAGLILISPLCKAPSWSEWLSNKVSFVIFSFQPHVE